MKHFFTLLFACIIATVSYTQFYTETWDANGSWGFVDLDTDTPVSKWAPLDLSGAPAPYTQLGNAVVSPSTTLNPDNLLISPAIPIGDKSGNMKMTFDIIAVAGSPGTIDNFSLYLVTDTANIVAQLTAPTPKAPDYVAGIPGDNTLYTYEIDLTSFIGNTNLFLLFRHHNSPNQSGLVLDNIRIYNASINASSNTGCVGSTLTFTNSSVGTYSSYTWDFGADATPATATGIGPHSVTYSAIGTKTVSVHPLGVLGLAGDTNSINIEITDQPVPSFTASSALGCAPMTVVFTSANQGNTCNYTFSDGVSVAGCTATRTFNTPGTYDVTLTETIDASCMGSTAQPAMITVNGTVTPNFTASATTVDMVYPYVQFSNLTAQGSTGYVWLFDDNSPPSSDIHAKHLFPKNVAQDYNVSLVTTSAAGCTDTLTKVIHVKETVIFFIPNSFSPNGDELNNTFEPSIFSGIDPDNYNLKIFGRGGELIFESNDPAIGWDGDYGSGRGLAQTGIYTYKLEFSTKENDEKRQILGHVNLVR